MSIPRNHHFVSQVLIKKFLGAENMLFTYSKSQQKLEEKIYSRQDFAERDLNSTIDSNGEIDHKSVEDNLNKYFETDFNKHYEIIVEGLKIDDYSKFPDSLKHIIKMGIIGDMRTPDHRNEIHNAFFDVINPMMELATKELKKDYSDFLDLSSKVKNIAAINYDEISNEILKSMGNIIYSIFIAPKNNYYFLPDNSSITYRSRLEPDTILPNGEILINPSMPISTVIIPINSELLIIAQSSTVCPQNQNGIYQISEETLIEYNQLLLQKSRDKVICMNKEYLERFIHKHSVNN